jgi:hypothetical protein
LAKHIDINAHRYEGACAKDIAVMAGRALGCGPIAESTVRSAAKAARVQIRTRRSSPNKNDDGCHTDRPVAVSIPKPSVRDDDGFTTNAAVILGRRIAERRNQRDLKTVARCLGVVCESLESLFGELDVDCNDVSTARTICEKIAGVSAANLEGGE